MNTFIKFGCLIGFACAMATPVFAGEEKVHAHARRQVLRCLSG